MFVSDICARNAEFFGDADAVIDPGSGRRLSWSELELRVNQLARALRDELGLAKGERLTMFAPNCAEYLEFYFACARSGLIGNAVNIRLSAGEIARYLRHVEPRAALVHGSLAAAADEWLPDVPSLTHVVGFGPDHGRAIDLGKLLDGQPGSDPAYPLDEDDPYQLAATSGTTGTAKAAVMTHRNAIAAMLNWAAELPIAERSTYFQCIPMFFNPGGPAGIHPAMLKGGRSVIYPAFEPRTFLRAVSEFAVTHAVLVPTMVRMVLDQPDCASWDFSSLRSFVIGGSPIPRSLLEQGRAVFGDVFFPFYGMAESYSTGMVLRREEQFTQGTEKQLRHLLSAGKPMVGVAVRVVASDSGADVARDNQTPGEIWMRGANVCGGYFRMPEETAAVRAGEWLKTGDIAVVDDEGFVTIVDRSKDIIITGGINVYSRDIEDALHAHPDVRAAAAIGVPHERWGEAVHAVVVLSDGASVIEEELIEFAAERLARFKKPRSLEFVDELPLNATGKVVKRELRARHAARV
ncbi:MAG: class I adenylate-forming enzyme family protein [Solirubrobacteraceae bacterium]